MSEHHQHQQEAAPAVAVYMRVSNEQQRRRGTIETQRPDLDRYVAAYGIKPYGWYEDPAVSGHFVPFPERPQGKRLLADARAGHVNLVLVWRLDRFGRDAREIHNAVHDLEEAGARLISLKESFDTRTPAGKLMLGVLASVAEFEWASIQERTIAGMERRLDKRDGSGWMGGPTPYGYHVEGTKEHATLVLDDVVPLGIPEYPLLTAAGVVRLMYEWLLDEKVSSIEIADRLNKLGVPTSAKRRGVHYRPREGREVPPGRGDEAVRYQWRADAVCKMLHNPVYKGLYQFGRRSAHHAGRPVVTCEVPALITPERWEAAQAQLTKNQKANTGNLSYDYLLRGLIKCGMCGHSFTPDPYRSGPGYACRNRRRPKLVWGEAELAAARRCTLSPRLQAPKLEAKIWHRLDIFLHHPDEALEELEVLLHGQADAATTVRAKLAEKQREQAGKQEERDKVIELWRKGRIGERDLDRQLDQIAEEERDLVKAAAKLMEQLGAADAVAMKLDAAATLLRDLRGRLDAGPLTFAMRRDIVEKLIKRIVVGSERDEATGKLRPVLKVTTVLDPDDDNPEDSDDPDDPTPGGGDEVGIFDKTLWLSRTR